MKTTVSALAVGLGLLLPASALAQTGPPPDTVAPVTVAELSSPAGEPRNGWYRGTVTWSLRAHDPGPNASGVALIEENFSGRGFEPYGGPFPFPVPEGYEGATDTVTFRSRDVAGNLEETKSVVIRRDIGSPSTKVEREGPERVRLVSEDGASGVEASFFRLDGGPEQRYSAPIAVPPGTHRLTFWSMDVAGNVEPAQEASVTGPEPPEPPAPRAPAPPATPATPAIPAAPATPVAPITPATPVVRTAASRVRRAVDVAALLRRGFNARVACASDCRASARLLVTSRRRGADKRRVQVAASSARAVSGGRAATLRLRATGSRRARLRAVGQREGPTAARLELRLTFADGSTRKLVRRVSLRP